MIPFLAGRKAVTKVQGRIPLSVCPRFDNLYQGSIVKKEIGGGASEDDLAGKGICSQAW